jgi:hypothetical protein
MSVAGVEATTDDCSLAVIDAAVLSSMGTKAGV